VGIFNRRNAAVGWVTWLVGKRIVKRKVRGVVPAVDPQTKRPNRSAVALLVAGALGALTFWRSRSSGGDDESTE
jgi:hypothetical protein